MSVWDTRYPEHVAVHRSVNGGLVHGSDCIILFYFLLALGVNLARM